MQVKDLLSPVSTPDPQNGCFVFILSFYCFAFLLFDVLPMKINYVAGFVPNKLFILHAVFFISSIYLYFLEKKKTYWWVPLLAFSV